MQKFLFNLKSIAAFPIKDSAQKMYCKTVVGKGFKIFTFYCWVLSYRAFLFSITYYGEVLTEKLLKALFTERVNFGHCCKKF